jgi:hypothetical protein
VTLCEKRSRTWLNLRGCFLPMGSGATNRSAGEVL